MLARAISDRPLPMCCMLSIPWLKITIISLCTAIDFSREEFAQTLAVIGSVRGRAPVVVDQKHIACVEGGGMNVCLYPYNKGNFSLEATLQVCMVQINRVNTIDPKYFIIPNF